MKNRKNLEKHKQFVSGWVWTVYEYQEIGSSFMILKSEVMPYQKWVAIKLRGISVETTHCRCLAGLGESRSHVWALIFKLESVARVCFATKTCANVAW